jgi:hypothetical protein
MHKEGSGKWNEPVNGLWPESRVWGRARARMSRDFWEQNRAGSYCGYALQTGRALRS